MTGSFCAEVKELTLAKPALSGEDYSENLECIYVEP